MEFCHLHLHSEYSILEGACRISEIPKACTDLSFKSVAISDRASMSGCVAFFRACKAEGIHPVIGCELEASLHTGSKGSVVLLCENAEGYRNLCFLLSAYCTGENGCTALSPAILSEHRNGLIALSGGAEGEIFSLMDRGDYAAAEECARKLLGIFGKDNFYIELQNHGASLERTLLNSQYELAGRLGIGVVATNDVKYLKRTDAGICTALCCIREGKTLAEGAGPSGNEYFLKSAEEMEKIFGGFEGAIENTVKIAERCSFEFNFNDRFLPAFPLPVGKNAKDELRRIAKEGMDALVREKRIPSEGFSVSDYSERMDYELSVIEKMGYCDYFLIVADYVSFAKKNGIPVGPGRGSGCGSAVAFFTGITDVDPLKYDLYFERFLNPERVSMPDIDIDFDFSLRDEVLSYVKRKYGQDSVTQIITFGTLAPRAALRDACRLNGINGSDCDRIMFLLPREDMTLSEVCRLPKVKAACDGDLKTKRVFDTALMLEGYPRNISVHAAGVVITDGPAYDYLPLTMSGDTLITQYDMDTVASLGLLKFDFLALRYLTVLRLSEAAIKEDYPDFDGSKIPENDPKTFSMLRMGKTAGVFQLEKEGITVLIRKIRPSCVEDIIDALALYRPGPMDSIPVYLRGRQNPQSVTYPHPLLEPVLKSTRGCLIYQEQVMSVFRILAGYTAGHADLVRRAMSKKKAEALLSERDSFVGGASERGLSQKEAESLFDSMASFAGYAFNKSHAVAYGLITYKTAYFKANYPGYYITALMNISGGNEKMEDYASEAAFFGLRLLPPDVNESKPDFRMTKDGIRFGLSFLKGSGPMFAEAVYAAAKEKPFVSLKDFVARVPRKAFSRRAAEAAILAGAFDSFKIPRAGLIALLEYELSADSESRKGGIDGQMDIFSASSDEENAHCAEEKIPEHILNLPEYPAAQLRAFEQDICGMAFTQNTKEEVRAEKRTVPENHAPCEQNGNDVQKNERKQPVLFVRVPAKDSEIYRKCVNLAEIFEGRCALVFYCQDTGKYETYAHGIDRSEKLMGFFRELAGDGAVVAKN